MCSVLAHALVYQTNGNTDLVNKGRDDPESRELGRKVLDTLWARYEIQKENSFLRNPSRLEDIDSHDSRAT